MIDAGIAWIGGGVIGFLIGLVTGVRLKMGDDEQERKRLEDGYGE